MANEKRIADAKDIIQNSANLIVDNVAARVKEGMSTGTIYNFVVGKINKKVDDFKIDYSICRKEICDDF